MMGFESTRPIRRVAFFVAMEGEGRGLIDELGLEAKGPLQPGLPSVWYEGTQPMPNGELLYVAVAVAGLDEGSGCDRIGTEAAVLTTFLLCQRCTPDLLINAGTCGGFESRGGKVGGLYLGAKAFLFHGRRIPLPGFQEFGIGRIPALPAAEVAKVIGADLGVVSSSNDFVTTPEVLAFFKGEGVSAKDMEAAAVARLARDLGIPFLAIKAVTDLVDHPQPEHESFLQHYQGVTSQLTECLVGLINWLSQGRNLGNLNQKPGH